MNFNSKFSEPELIKFYESFRSDFDLLGLEVSVNQLGRFGVFYKTGGNPLFYCDTVEGLYGFVQGFKSRVKVATSIKGEVE